MMDIQPDGRERFPSGSTIAIDFNGRAIWIDGACLGDAQVILRRVECGEITAPQAEELLYALEYGSKPSRGRRR